MRIAGSTLVAITLLAMAGVALADAAADAPAKPPHELLAKALQTSMVEVELGKLAQRHAESTGVNALGVRLQRDHARIGKALTTISRSKGLVEPISLDSTQRAQIDALSAKRGVEFDKAYVVQLVTNHNAAVSLFTTLAESDDKDLSQFARLALPILREDRRLAGSYEKLSPEPVPAVASK